MFDERQFSALHRALTRWFEFDPIDLVVAGLVVGFGPPRRLMRSYPSSALPVGGTTISRRRLLSLPSVWRRAAHAANAQIAFGSLSPVACLRSGGLVTVDDRRRPAVRCKHVRKFGCDAIDSAVSHSPDEPEKHMLSDDPWLAYGAHGPSRRRACRRYRGTLTIDEIMPAPGSSSVQTHGCPLSRVERRRRANRPVADQG